MAFRKKAKSIVDLNPDLVVIQECEEQSKLQEALADYDVNQVVWYGRNPNKGIAIISFGNIRISLSSNFNTDYEYVVPVEVVTPSRTVMLYAIWAMPHQKKYSQRYIGQVIGALEYYKSQLHDASILVGDFNSNTIWDKNYPKGNHSDMVDALSEAHIISIYHLLHKVEHGNEPDPTLYLLKKKLRPYHIDYCFTSENLISDKTTITLGTYEDWIHLSDHMPLIVDNLDL